RGAEDQPRGEGDSGFLRTAHQRPARSLGISDRAADDREGPGRLKFRPAAATTREWARRVVPVRTADAPHPAAPAGTGGLGLVRVLRRPDLLCERDEALFARPGLGAGDYTCGPGCPGKAGIEG